MKTLFKYTLSLLALCALLLTLASCAETLNGNYVPAENNLENGGITYYFTNTEVTMTMLMNDEVIQYVCNYEILQDEEDPDKQIITTVYTDVLYYGTDSTVSASVEAMKKTYVDGTVHKAEFVRGDGYVIIGGVKLIKDNG